MVMKSSKKLNLFSYWIIQTIVNLGVFMASLLNLVLQVHVAGANGGNHPVPPPEICSDAYFVVKIFIFILSHKCALFTQWIYLIDTNTNIDTNLRNSVKKYKFWHDCLQDIIPTNNKFLHVTCILAFNKNMITCVTYYKDWFNV